MNKRNFFITNILTGIVIGIIASLIFSLGFVNPAINSSSSYNYKISESEKTLYDYRVYDPIESQIDEMNSQSFIDAVFEYFTSSVTVSKGSQNYNTDAMYSKNITALNISSYNEDRIIDGEYDISVNEVFIDKIIADKLDVAIGDKVVVFVKGNELELTVCAIFEDNTFYDRGSIFFMLDDELISNLGLNTTSYSAVLIEASDEILTYQYLETYIPLGAILPREYFSSNSEYDAYINNYMSDDYSSRIYVKNDVLNSLKNTYSEYLTNSRNMITIGSVIFVILMSTINLKLVFAFKYSKEYAKRTKTSIPTTEFRKNYLIIDASSFILSLIIILFILIRSMNQNIVYSNFLNTFLSVFIPMYIIAFLIINIVDQIAISNINPKLRNKSKVEELVYLKTLTVQELRIISKEREIINIATMSKEEIIAELIKNTPVEDKKKRIK